MAKFWVAILAVCLLGVSASALAQDAQPHTRLVIPVINQGDEMVVMDLDHKVTKPGSRYLAKKHSATVSLNDPARQGRRLSYDHTLVISRVTHGIESLCRIKIHTSNIAGRPGSRLTYCSAASDDERCRLELYNEAQVCYVLVTVH
ncbi:MAG: hypothetical protein KQI62_07240 [Deltaproteobacteria bacterium]|nr:hypothetical protein [Deltaproteobacteria bacterium]